MRYPLALGKFPNVQDQSWSVMVEWDKFVIVLFGSILFYNVIYVTKDDG